MRKPLLSTLLFFSFFTAAAAEDRPTPGGRFCHDYKVLVAHLGARFEESDDHLRVTPAPEILGGGRIDCGLAGTVMRFLPPLAALAQQPTEFFGDPAASQRPMAPLLGALAALGAEVSQPHSLRSSGIDTGGPAPLNQTDRQAFAKQLDRFLAHHPALPRKTP